MSARCSACDDRGLIGPAPARGRRHAWSSQAMAAARPAGAPRGQYGALRSESDGGCALLVARALQAQTDQKGIGRNPSAASQNQNDDDRSSPPSFSRQLPEAQYPELPETALGYTRSSERRSVT